MRAKAGPSRFKQRLRPRQADAGTIRFHLDENCSRSIADGLRRRGIDVTTTPEVGLMGATDEQQAAHGLAEGRVLFTQDQDFLRLDAEGVPMRASRTASRTPSPSASSSRASS